MTTKRSKLVERYMVVPEPEFDEEETYFTYAEAEEAAAHHVEGSGGTFYVVKIVGEYRARAEQVR